MQVWGRDKTLETLSYQCIKCFSVFHSDTPFYALSFELRYNKPFNAVQKKLHWILF